MLMLLDIGHSTRDKGACNETCNETEFDFNDELASDIIAVWQGEAEVKKFYRSSYGAIPSEVNAQNPDYVISLHCNAFNKQASYTTVLHAQGKPRCQKMAGIIQKNLVAAMGLKDAGVKAISRDDRGGNQVHGISCPNVICEPFFIDNDSDLATAKAKRQELVGAYVAAMQEVIARHV